MENINVVITSPSIKKEENVGGISNVVSLLLNENKEINYKHFVVGRKDSQERNIFWIINQVEIILMFIKLFYSQRNIRICHFNIALAKYSILIYFVIISISKCFRKRIITHLHGGELNFNYNINKIQKFIIKTIVNKSDIVIVLGNKEYIYISEYYNIKNRDKIIVLPNAVKLPYKINSIDFDKESVLKILYIGRVDYNKGFIELLDALTSLKDKLNFEFYLAGTGIDFEAINKKLKENLNEKYIYMGVLGEKDKGHLFENMNLFILPSYFEGLPLSLLETMAYGIVPMVTPVGSIPEVVIDNENGVIIPIHNSEEIVKKVINLTNNKVLFCQMREAAYNTIINNYSIDHYIEKLNIIYRKLNPI